MWERVCERESTEALHQLDCIVGCFGYPWQCSYPSTMNVPFGLTHIAGWYQIQRLQIKLTSLRNGLSKNEPQRAQALLHNSYIESAYAIKSKRNEWRNERWSLLNPVKNIICMTLHTLYAACKYKDSNRKRNGSTATSKGFTTHEQKRQRYTQCFCAMCWLLLFVCEWFFSFVILFGVFRLINLFLLLLHIFWTASDEANRSKTEQT